MFGVSEFARVIYDGSTVSHLKAPGGQNGFSLRSTAGAVLSIGVAMDNYFVYWLNKAGAPKARCHG